MGAGGLGFHSRAGQSGRVLPTARHRCDVSSELRCPGAKARRAPSLVIRFNVKPRVNKDLIFFFEKGFKKEKMRLREAKNRKNAFPSLTWQIVYNTHVKGLPLLILATLNKSTPPQVSICSSSCKNTTYRLGDMKKAGFLLEILTATLS